MITDRDIEKLKEVFVAKEDLNNQFQRLIEVINTGFKKINSKFNQRFDEMEIKTDTILKLVDGQDEEQRTLKRKVEIIEQTPTVAHELKKAKH